MTIKSDHTMHKSRLLWGKCIEEKSSSDQVKFVKINSNAFPNSSCAIVKIPSQFNMLNYNDSDTYYP